MNTNEVIVTMEKQALEQWSGGNPAGYGIHFSKDATYFDDIGAQNRLISEKWQEYGNSLKEMIPPHKYEMVNPLAQVYNDNTAVLSYFYQPFDDEGNKLTKWRASVTYVKIEGNWKVVHAHWTMIKEEAQE